MKNLPIRVAVADDHPIALSGLELLIRSDHELEFCGQARDLAGIGRLLEEQNPQVLISDLILGRHEAGENLVRWKRDFPATGIVILTIIADPGVARALLDKGALGFVCKDDDPGELLMAVKAAARGEHYLGKTVRDASGPGEDAIDVSPLTERERQVFRLVGEGHSNKTISGRLFLSVKTVETHKEHIKNKLSLQQMADLQIAARKWCLQNGLRVS